MMEGASRSKLDREYSRLVQRLTLVLHDSHAAQDVADAAYRRASRRRGQPEVDDTGAWLNQVGLQLAFKAGRHRPRGTDASWVPLEQVGLWSALASLGPRERASLLLHILDGRSAGEIATGLGEANGTVAAWISSARATLREAAADLRGQLAVLEHAAPAPPPSSEPRPRRRAVTWLPVAAVVVSGSVVGLFGARILGKPSSGAAPEASPSGPVVTALAWASVPFDKDAFLTDLAVDGDRIIAIGSKAEQPTAWFSDDGGESWESTTIPQTPPGKDTIADLRLVAARGATVVAIGEWRPAKQDEQTEFQPMWRGWVSDNHGETWTQVDTAANGVGKSGVVFDIADTPSGFIALGADYARGTLVGWASPDGHAWQPTQPQGLPQFRGSQMSLATDGNRVIAGGTREGRRPRPGVWTSTDGLRWRSILEKSAEQGNVTDVAIAGDRLLAVGMTFSGNSSSTSTAMLWESADGTTWQSHVLDHTPGSQAGSIATGPLGTVIAGVVGTDTEGTFAPRVWFLPLGATKPMVQLPSTLGAVIALPDRFVAIGGQRILIGRPAQSAPESAAPTSVKPSGG